MGRRSRCQVSVADPRAGRVECEQRRGMVVDRSTVSHCRIVVRTLAQGCRLSRSFGVRARMVHALLHLDLADE